MLLTTLPYQEFTRGDIQERHTVTPLSATDGGQPIIAPLIDDLVTEGHARGDHLGHTSLHDGLGLLRILQLIADGHAVAGTDQLGHVGFQRMVRKARQFNITAPVVPPGQRNTKDPRDKDRIRAEGLIEITDTEQQERIRILPLDRVVLVHQRGLPGCVPFLCPSCSHRLFSPGPQGTSGPGAVPPTQPSVLHIFRTSMPVGDRKLHMDELGRSAPGDPRVLPGRKIRVVLDDVRSRHNVGSIFRTCDAFGAERIHLCGMTPLPPHREIEKTALGATETVPWVHEEDVASTVEHLRSEGYYVLAVEQTVNAVPLDRLADLPNAPLALVFGNELRGISDAVVTACDRCVIVPQFGSKHSLNVSVCAGVVLWAVSASERSALELRKNAPR